MPRHKQHTRNFNQPAYRPEFPFFTLVLGVAVSLLYEGLINWGLGTYGSRERRRLHIPSGKADHQKHRPDYRNNQLAHCEVPFQSEAVLKLITDA